MAIREVPPIIIRRVIIGCHCVMTYKPWVILTNAPLLVATTVISATEQKDALATGATNMHILSGFLSD